VHLFILAAPLVSLGVAAGAAYHFTGQVCWLSAPPWDDGLSLLLPLIMGLVAAGAALLGVTRHVLLHRVLVRAGVVVGGEIQALADAAATSLGTASVRVLVRPYHRPLAFTYGIRQPSLLISTWMLDHLDTHELEAVLAHEIAHVARGDSLFAWVATILRDAFFYLPTSRAAYALVRQDRELASDDLAAGATRRPLALASALARVWAASCTAGSVGSGGSWPKTSPLAPALLGTGLQRESPRGIERRIERLLSPSWASECAGGAADRRPSAVATLSWGALALGSLLALEAANIMVMLAPLGCGPHAPVVALLGRYL
jgi:hypothetical protein